MNNRTKEFLEKLSGLLEEFDADMYINKNGYVAFTVERETRYSVVEIPRQHILSVDIDWVLDYE